ncbi:uncharacterized protein AMSG_03902 [Thecamonas trahens ATCC 50062]|uniref:Uncharacterized protein n=1 Tax=Thecamonas trahens ATCC 50062 TaxID=461836 RepID=A0A0L0D6H5_THETB|nr:hypothetical protein AMSG_03902 [Thecamonas trahens ATCC 50062]KNC47671.1 hypothetical protein AMSG_03902 [Thecamonas trahens ATCC 50062]|eukprot:XP_013759155.1 hypothetical protein AMSG_03902 [Thecamonas trahens ATCC 50062]
MVIMVWLLFLVVVLVLVLVLVLVVLVLVVLVLVALALVVFVLELGLVFAAIAFSAMYLSQCRNPYSWYWTGRGLRPLPSSVELDDKVAKLASFKERSKAQEDGKGKAQLCVSFIASHRRHNQGYLIHSLNSLVRNAADGVLDKTDVFYNVLDAELCKDNQHADIVAERSPVMVFRPPVYDELEWESESIESGSPKPAGLNFDLKKAQANVAHLRKDQCRSAFRLQTLDYAYSLYANSHWCKYTLAIEDDAFAAPRWDVKALAVAYELEGRDPQWLSAKLYYPSNWGAEDAPFILAVASQIGVAYALAARFWLARTRRVTFRLWSLPFLFLFLWGGAVGFGVIRLSSKQAIFPLPQGTYPIRNGMVTTAYLFNNANAESVIKYWRVTAHDGEAKDTAYNSYLHTPLADPYNTYMHVPHLFQHVGFHSATQHAISEAEYRTRKMSNVFDGEFVL